MTSIEPIHPGEVLLEEFLELLAVSQNRLAVAIGVPPHRINEIVHGKRRVTADTALRLARCFGTTDRFWLNIQTRYDLEAQKDNLGHALDKVAPSPRTRPARPPRSAEPRRRFSRCQRTRANAHEPGR